MNGANIVQHTRGGPEGKTKEKKERKKEEVNNDLVRLAKKAAEQGKGRTAARW